MVTCPNMSLVLIHLALHYIIIIVYCKHQVSLVPINCNGICVGFKKLVWQVTIIVRNIESQKRTVRNKNVQSVFFGKNSKTYMYHYQGAQSTCFGRFYILISISFTPLQMCIFAKSASFVTNQSCAIITYKSTNVTLVNWSVDLVFLFVFLNFRTVVRQEITLFTLEMSHVKVSFPNMRI